MKKILALASLATLTLFVAGCDHMAARDSGDARPANGSANASTMDAPTGASRASSGNESPATRGAPVTDDATWDRLDANRDGYLTKDELLGSPGLAQHFEQADTDGDGKISMQEWKTYGRH
jgi:hypothetical protein